MLSMIFTILLIVVGVPVALLVAWKMLGLLWSIISNMAGVVFAVIMIIVVIMLISMIV
jgi:hypothetical protein